MRVLPLVLALCLTTPALSGCELTPLDQLGIFAAANAAAVPVFGRTLPDVVYSGITGKDCSMVRLERGQSYCRPVDPPLEPQPFCTHSLGTVDCWANPQAFPSPPTQVGSAQQPTAEQEAYRTRRWPDF